VSIAFALLVCFWLLFNTFACSLAHHLGSKQQADIYLHARYAFAPQLSTSGGSDTTMHKRLGYDCAQSRHTSKNISRVFMLFYIDAVFRVAVRLQRCACPCGSKSGVGVLWPCSCSFAGCAWEAPTRSLLGLTTERVHALACACPSSRWHAT